MNHDESDLDMDELFPPEERDQFFDGNMPCPGDILLLDGDGANSRISRRVQGGSPFSHVGMVVSTDLYIDAVLRDGVRVRRIAEIALSGSGYVPKRCEVARHEDIVKLLKPVWTTALEYYRNPYKLRAVFRPGFKADQELEPMICSKLVSEILEDLKIKTGLKRRLLLQPFPKDISKVCCRDKWKRFALLDYDLFLPASKTLTSHHEQFTRNTLEQLETLHTVNLGWRALKRMSSALGANCTKGRR